MAGAQGDHEAGFDSALAEVRSLLAAGEPLAAFDRAVVALEGLGPDFELRYLSVLALARSGATEAAELRFAQLGLDRDPPPEGLVEDVSALRGRLAKDRALAAGHERRAALAAEAATLYEATFARTGGHFPAINAATMTMLAGDRPRGQDLAKRAKAAALDVEPRDAEAAFWRHASIAEAELILGNVAEAERALVAAVGSGGDAPARRAVTRRQLRVVAAVTGVDASSCQSILANPSVVHYCGNRFDFAPEVEADLRARVDAVLERLGVGAGWGSLAAGGDIVWAEALVERGAQLHVVMPCEMAQFVAASVAPSGRRWVERFDECFAAANSVVQATTGPLLGHDALFDYTSRRAMGEAVLQSDRLDAPVHQVAIWDGCGEDSHVGTGADVATWRGTGRTTTVVEIGADRGSLPAPAAVEGPEREIRSMLFGDVAGFSRLAEDRLPVFFSEVMGAIAEAIDAYEAVSYRNSWGDGIYVVLDDPVAAARLALDMQRAVEAVDRRAHGLPADLRLRLGAHAGPVFTGHDPIRDEATYFGAEVTRTARIEPRTPPGEVYLTDALASLVRLDAPEDFACEYVGHIPAAKGYGELPMYRLAARF